MLGQLCSWHIAQGLHHTAWIPLRRHFCTISPWIFQQLFCIFLHLAGIVSHHVLSNVADTHAHTMIFFEALSRTIRQKRRRTGLWWRSECGSFQSWKNQDYVPSPGPFHWSATVMAPSIVLWLCLIFLVNVIFPNCVCIAVHFVGSPFRSGFFSRLVVGLRTQSYCTFAELEQHCVRSLSGLAEIPWYCVVPQLVGCILGSCDSILQVALVSGYLTQLCPFERFCGLRRLWCGAVAALGLDFGHGAT